MSSSKAGESSRRSSRKRGQAVVEFALVFPIFMLVLAGIFDFGFALYSRMTVINAAREGARAAAMVSDPSTASTVASNAATTAAQQAGLTPSSVVTACLQTSVSPTSPATIPCAGAVMGDSVVVTVHSTYHTFFPLLFGATFDLSSTVQMVLDSAGSG